MLVGVGVFCVWDEHCEEREFVCGDDVNVFVCVVVVVRHLAATATKLSTAKTTTP